MRGRTIDVSASGVLLRVAAPPAPAARGEAREPVALDLLRELFGTSFQVRFDEHEVSARARLVRVSRAPEDPGVLLVGCEFALNLHDRQLARLGVKDRSRALPPATPTSILPLDVRDDAPVEVHVRDGDDANGTEPLCAGRLVGLGGPVLAAQVGPEAPPRVAARLDGRRLGVRVVHDDEEIWSVGARLLSVRLLPTRPAAAEVALLTEDPPTREVSERFRHVQRAP
jgi:hypothetical protein